MREITATVGADINLGRVGEHEATCVMFDYSDWIATHGEGSVQLIHQRNGDRDVYPVAIDAADGVARWVVTNADVAAAGRGWAELRYFVGDTRVKSQLYATVTERALGARESTPAPYQKWVDRVLEAAVGSDESASQAAGFALRAEAAEAIARGAADEAEAYANSYPVIGDNENWFVGGEDTGKPSRGQDGPPGPTGPQGEPGRDGRLPPTLTTAQKNALNNVAAAYASSTYRNKFVYDYTPGPDIYADKSTAYKNVNGVKKARINCNLFVLLVWMGIHPSKFDAPDTYSPTFADGDKAFDWGYKPKFQLRERAYGVLNTDANGEITPAVDPAVGITEEHLSGFTKPYHDSYKDSYSNNSAYSPSAALTLKVKIGGEDVVVPNAAKQLFKAFYHGSDLARELYQMGCEIPASDIARGDLVFYSDPSAHRVGTAFREITHAAFVHKVDRETGYIQMIESLGGGVQYTGLGFNSSYDRQYSAGKLNRIVMAARHPAAFGLSNPVGDAFTKWPVPENAAVGVDWPSETDDSLYMPEEQRNKVTEITESATDEQYPSAAAVFHAIQGAMPVKGVDYWTEEDKQEIIAAVLAAMSDTSET